MKNSTDNIRFLKPQKYIFVCFCVFGFLYLLGSCGFRREKNGKNEGLYSILSNKSLQHGSLKFITLTYPPTEKLIINGADQIHLILDSLKGKKVAVVGNQTSVVGKRHLVDTLLALKVNVVKVFSPEHGFRGTVDAGEKVNSSIDAKTGLPLISLYGDHKKPKEKDISDVDVFVFDIQDVGARFYTYISTLHYIMEAAAESKKKVYLLDRPNPNGHYVDGPVLDTNFRSFVGMHPVPIVYGMTIGEYAKMINGEGWLKGKITCNLQVVTLQNYTHQSRVKLTIPPSPNLKTARAIELYPSLCLFEATTVSLGRGTDKPFELFGHPKFPNTGFSFTPKPMPGALQPLQFNVKCNGFDLTNSDNGKRPTQLNLTYVLTAAEHLADTAVFIDHNSFFNKLAGNSTLKDQIHECWRENEIRATWKSGLDTFLLIRKKYLLYP
jgi:uncharacterized protein YbbC (DUF1343 family)